MYLILSYLLVSDQILLKYRDFSRLRNAFRVNYAPFYTANTYVRSILYSEMISSNLSNIPLVV